MSPSQALILTINGGSSSIKFALYADHSSAVTFLIDWLEEQPDLSGASIIPWRSRISSDYTRGG
jgi:acetate kinase